MQSLTTFHFFNKLPKEIQARIWKLHREHRGIRHYITVSWPGTRHYAAIDIETNLFTQTLLSDQTASVFWDRNDRPIKGESDAKVHLVGLNHVSEPGDFAKSVATAKYPTTWETISRPQIRINYKKDVVLLEGDYVCLLPIFRLTHALPIRPGDLLDHWLANVQYLAVNVAGWRSRAERAIARMPVLKKLYLVVYRDPECRHGAPLQWKSFDKSLLDRHNFLSFGDFVRLHPKNNGLCDCDVKKYRSAEARAAFQAGFNFEDKPRIPISIVADPY